MIIQAKNVALCPECGADIRFRKPPFVRQRKFCVECGTELEVVSKTPLALVVREVGYEEEEEGEFDYG
jgi:lysine biosynthesis protein LysW